MPTRGEVWMVDLGMVAETRPCLLLSDEPPDDEPALVNVIPHTTSTRGSRWENSIPKNFLKPGAFHLQQLTAAPLAKLTRRLGSRSDSEFSSIRPQLRDLLEL